jgi:hypothetical protein
MHPKNFDMHWGTEAELNYIDHIGTYREQRARPPLSRLDRLLNYHKSLLKKKEWGAINEEVVKRYTRQLIMKETGGR